jgi:hypothetical protein
VILNEFLDDIARAIGDNKLQITKFTIKFASFAISPTYVMNKFPSLIHLIIRKTCIPPQLEIYEDMPLLKEMTIIFDSNNDPLALFNVTNLNVEKLNIYGVLGLEGTAEFNKLIFSPNEHDECKSPIVYGNKNVCSKIKINTLKYLQRYQSNNDHHVIIFNMEVTTIKASDKVLIYENADQHTQKKIHNLLQNG